jgi:hypothetical protein
MTTSNKKTKQDNPQPGDLVMDIHSPSSDGPLIVLDFFPWGLDGKHAWSVVNPQTGKKKILTKRDIIPLLKDETPK